MFHSAAVKLTTYYLGIIMVLSLGCSLALYNVSSSDLQHNAERQVGYFRGLIGNDNANSFSDLRQRQIDQDLAHLRGNLFFFNLLVLIGGGAASYGLARRTLRPIEETLEAQTRFTSDASHELRTPLAAIQTENEVTLRNPGLTKSQAVKQLESNLEEVAKLKALSEGLLALANTDKEDGYGETVAVKDIISDAKERIEKVAEIKKIRIGIKQSDKDLSVKGNRQNLADLLVILLDNSIKYSPDGSQVKIEAKKQSKNVLISVIDHGTGISSSELPHIFDRFYRTDSSRSKSHLEGYGLGLAIAKKISDLHGGSIEVKSAPGKGSSFILKLPV